MTAIIGLPPAVSCVPAVSLAGCRRCPRPATTGAAPAFTHFSSPASVSPHPCRDDESVSIDCAWRRDASIAVAGNHLCGRDNGRGKVRIRPNLRLAARCFISLGQTGRSSALRALPDLRLWVAGVAG